MASSIEVLKSTIDKQTGLAGYRRILVNINGRRITFSEEGILGADQMLLLFQKLAEMSQVPTEKNL